MKSGPHVDHDNQRIVATVAGPILFSHFERNWNARHRRHTLSYAELTDARGATAEFSATDARQIVDLIATGAITTAIGPMAVVVSNSLTFGMVRMLGLLSGGSCEIRPFYELEAAEEWLGWRALRAGGEQAATRNVDFRALSGFRFSA